MVISLFLTLLVGCTGSDDTDGVIDTMDTGLSTEADTDAGTEADTDTGTAPDTDTDAPPQPVTLYTQGWEELPAPQSIYVGAPDGMTMVNSTSGEVGGIETQRQSPSYSAASGLWVGYLQVRGRQTGDVSVGLRTEGLHTVQSEGEAHQVTVRVGRSIAAVPAGGLILSMQVGGQEVATTSLAPDNFSFFGDYGRLDLSYTTVPGDVGRSATVELSTFQGPGSGVWSLLVDDLSWSYTP